MSSHYVDERLKSAYGPDGNWARLFRRDPAHHRTLLLRDISVTVLELRFLGSRKAYESFRQNNSQPYFALDKICDELTVA